MAALIKMICSDCGYNSGTLRLGTPLLDVRYMGPALDTEAQKIINVDWNRVPHNTIPYSSTNLYKKTANEYVFFRNPFSKAQENPAYKLSKVDNFCPKCNSFSLHINQWGTME